MRYLIKCFQEIWVSFGVYGWPLLRYRDLLPETLEAVAFMKIESVVSAALEMNWDRSYPNEEDEFGDRNSRNGDALQELLMEQLEQQEVGYARNLEDPQPSSRFEQGRNRNGKAKYEQQGWVEDKEKEKLLTKQQEAGYARNLEDPQSSSRFEQGRNRNGKTKSGQQGWNILPWGGDNEKEKKIAELTNHVQLLMKQLEQQEASYEWKLRDLKTSFHSVRFEQDQISNRLAKFERKGLELKNQQENFNRDTNGTFEKVRREIVGDQESMAKTAREVKNRLDTLDLGKALIMDRLKNLREDLSKQRGGGDKENGSLMVYERESTIQRMEVELKSLEAKSIQQGRLLIGIACGAVVIIAYLLVVILNGRDRLRG